MDDWDGAYSSGQGKSAKHSGVGVASFVIALVAGLLVFLCIIVAGVVEASDMGPIPEDSPLAVVQGLTIISGSIACLCGIALAIAGLMQENRNKVFAVIGLVFNGLILLGVALIILMALFLG